MIKRYPTPTISGGEAQRIKLAKELCKQNGRDNVYILDEPTTGLSFSDTERLIELMQQLVDAGNTIIVTEHDPSVLANCDYIVEMGPGGGSDGGYIIAQGTQKELKINNKSIIGKYLKQVRL
jgi:excinuclease ABC subunit A